jgi:hypothetical protein
MFANRRDDPLLEHGARAFYRPLRIEPPMPTTPTHRLHRLDEYLERLAPYLPPELVSAEHQARIQRVARLLPSVLALGFESRLADPHPAADFSIYFSTLARQRDPLAGRLPQRLTRHPVWQRALRLFAAWCDAGSPVHRVLANAWMELDLPVEGKVPTTPNLFLGTSRQWGGREDDLSWLRHDVVPLLTGEPLPAGVEAKVLRCVQALPPEGRVFQTGLMLARRTEALRLCIANVPPAGIVDYLRRAGWRGDEQALEDEVTALAGRSGWLYLALDIGGPGVAPRLGLECRADEGADWRPLLDFLVRRGLCLPVKGEALLAFPRRYQGAASAPFYPEDIALLTTRLGLWERRTVRLVLNHVKLTLGGSLPPEAKAYFGAHYMWEESPAGNA